MKLDKARVQNYKCIEDSEWIDLEQVTCLIGKNEAGKTAFLQALSKINSVGSNGDYDPLMEYPRRRYRQYMQRHHEENPDPAASIRFELMEEEVQEIESVYGDDCLEEEAAIVTKDYQNSLNWEIRVNQEIVVHHLIEEANLPPPTQNFISDASTFDELADRVEESNAASEGFETLEAKVNRIRNRGPSSVFGNDIGEEILSEYLPKFVYFDEYYQLRGRNDISEIIRREREGELNRADATFISLLSIADLTLEEVRDMTYFREVKAELESVSVMLTDELFDYWTQNENLDVEIDRSRDLILDEDEPSQNWHDDPFLHLGVRNLRNRATVSFDERSSGFVWFFSFLSYFWDYQGGDQDVILLLDEPGLNLHAKAQFDFLEFVDDRLATNHPVIYTTHSPFMLQPKKPERAKLVKDDSDRDEAVGTKISNDVLDTSDNEEAVFPLQANLGYDLIQTLLLGPHCLLVEGNSDLIYLQVMSELLERRDESTTLSPRWTKVPTNGAPNMPTFVSLFGASNLDIAILVDSDNEIEDRLEDIEARGLIDLDNVKEVADYIDDTRGDIEDIFSEEFYMELVNRTYELELRGHRTVPDQLNLDDLDSEHPRIVKRVEHYFENYGVSEEGFSHREPAAHLQKYREDLESEIEEETFERFENLFSDLNQILEN